MDSRTVSVDRSHSPHRVTFAPALEVVVPFVDRLAIGRGLWIAIRTAEGDGTCAELIDRASRQRGALPIPAPGAGR
jgi:hypothetical protein